MFIIKGAAEPLSSIGEMETRPDSVGGSKATAHGMVTPRGKEK